MRGILAVILLIPVILFASETGIAGLGNSVTLDKFSTRGLDSHGKLSWRLSGESAEMNGSIITVREFMAFFYQKEGGIVELSSPGCRFLQSLKEVKSDAPVRVKSDGILVEGIGYDVYLEGRVIRIRSSVRAVIRGNAVKIDGRKSAATGKDKK